MSRSTSPRRAPALCVLRPFKPFDELQVRDIMNEATMSTVGEFFRAALFSELCPELSFVAMAIGFVGFGLPFYFCLSLMPIAIVFMYAVIWSAHMVKALELHGDLSNIPATYQSEKDTGFWVAEVYDTTVSTELDAHFNVTKKVVYEFLTLEELDRRGDNLAEYRQHTVAGCIALTKSHNNQNWAWLRRFAVRSEYQRRNIASNLLEHVIQFSRDHEYKGLELVTTDCHHKARAMYSKTGFSMNMKVRHFINVSQPTYTFSMVLKKEKNEKQSLTDKDTQGPKDGTEKDTQVQKDRTTKDTHGQKDLSTKGTEGDKKQD